MLVRRREIDGTSKDIKHATIDMHVMQLAESFVHDSRILPYEFADAVDAEVTKVLCHAGTDTWNCLQLINHEQIHPIAARQKSF